MNYIIVSLSSINTDQVEQMSEIHQQELPSLLTDLGLPWILEFYNRARKDSNAFGFCALEENSDLIGWVIGSVAPWSLYQQIQKPVVLFALNLFRACLRSPQMFTQLLFSRFSGSTYTALDSEDVELLYIAVRPSGRGLGVAHALLDAFSNKCRQIGCLKILLSVETENKPALAFYYREGFKVRSSVQQGRFARLRMVKVL